MNRRNKFLVAAVFCWVFAMVFAVVGTNAYASDVSFSWLPNSETDLAGYKIHYGTTPSNYSESVNCNLPEIIEGRVQYTIENLPDSLLYYACTAYDTAGQESDYSNELNFNPVPVAPSTFSGVTVTVTVDVR